MIESLFLSFLLITKKPLFTEIDNKTYIVKGFVKSYTGNQIDIHKKKPFVNKAYKLLFVEGVYKHYGSNNFEINNLNSEYKIIKTNFNGEFDVYLTQGLYTIFILKGDKAYLNNFDGLGNYSYIEVKDNIENIIIRDVRNAYF